MELKDEYFTIFIGSNAVAMKMHDMNDEYDRDAFNAGNYYATQEEAQKRADAINKILKMDLLVGEEIFVEKRNPEEEKGEFENGRL